MVINKPVAPALVECILTFALPIYYPLLQLALYSANSIPPLTLPTFEVYKTKHTKDITSQTVHCLHVVLAQNTK